jgi:hypothetical protein
MRDQLLEIAGSYAPTFVEPYGREARKFVPREAEDLEV